MSTYPELKGKVVVVTGATGNLGSALVRRLHTEGMRLALVDHNLEKVHNAVVALGLDPANTLSAAIDITKKAEVERVFAQVEAEFGHVNALVNVAGGYRPGKPVHELDEDGWDAMLDLNARSVFLMSGAAARSMVAAGIRGRIITVSSRTALKGDATNAAYAASKSAALRITEALAAEMLDKGITVNAILPSAIDTPQNRASDPNGDHSRLVTPDSLADVIAFFLSDASRDISGASIPVYGRI